MTYDQAMDAIYRHPKVVVRRGDMRVSWRFGHEVILTAAGRHIAYTPTVDDMTATDWRVEAGS